jgi:hypothetical protein
MIRTQALAQAQDEHREMRLQVEVMRQQITALWARIDGIHNSLPGRIYHHLDWLPGLKKGLMGRGGPSSAAERGGGRQD